MIFSLKQLIFATFFFGSLDLGQIRVDQIANVVRIERALVFINDPLIELEHVLSILHNLVFGCGFAGQVLLKKTIIDRSIF